MGLEEYLIENALKYGRRPSFSFLPEPKPERLFCPIISADDHALEPANLFTERVASKYVDQAPFMVAQQDGTPWWNVDGKLVPVLLCDGSAGRPMREWGIIASRFEEFRPGVWDAKERLHDMDICGVWAQLCFSSLVWGFAGKRFSTYSDPDVGLACLRAYNDWMYNEWCGADHRRFISCQLPWLRDPEIGAQEIYRNAEVGFQSVSFSENPEGLGFDNVYKASWDPFFRACEETDTVINLHVGSSGASQVPTSSSAEEVTIALFPISGIEALMDWVYCGVLLKFPKLKIALSEAGVSWVPMAVERLRRAYRQSEGIGRGWPSNQPTPMEIVRRNFYFTSIEDPSAFHMLDLIGEDNILVETDYPHYDSTWPRCQEMIRGELAHLNPAQVRKLCFENAARVYRHSAPPKDLIDASEIGQLAVGRAST